LKLTVGLRNSQKKKQQEGQEGGGGRQGDSGEREEKEVNGVSTDKLWALAEDMFISPQPTS
jgi:hypothetical protein